MVSLSDGFAAHRGARGAELAAGRSAGAASQVRLIVALCLWLLALSGARADTGRWFGVYLQGRKVGHQFSQKVAPARWGTTPAVRYDDVSEMRVTLLGTDTRIRETDSRWCDPKSGATLASDTRVESAGRVTRIRATYLPRGVRFRAEVDGQASVGTLTLKPGESFVELPGPPALKVGWKRAGKTFLAETQTLADTEVEVVGKEVALVDGASVPAFRVAVRSTASETLLLDAQGELLRSDGALGLSVRRESKARALAPTEETADLAKLIAVTPTGVALDAPRAARSATYRIGGVTRPLPAFDGVQAVAPSPLPDPKNEKNERTFDVTVTVGPLPAGPAGALYPDRSAAPDALKPYLAPTPYVQCDDPELKALAKKTVGATGDAAEAARRLAAFVHQAIRPDTSVAAVRSARDIHTDRRGVCRDYTTYFTTLARAVGLPTRECVGLAFVDGAFYYHAWPQVWVGRWVVLEPTWGAPFADATHVALAEGGATALTGVMADIGHYRIEVLRVEGGR